MIYSMTAAFILIVDTWIKNHMERSISQGEEKRLKGKIILRHYHNEGAFLNMGEKKRPLVMMISLILTSVITLIFIVTLFHKGNHSLKLGLSLLLGGAFCNTYDRIKRKYVMDYLSFDVKWLWLKGIVFNISDFCIIIGALISALSVPEH